MTEQSEASTRAFGKGGPASLTPTPIGQDAKRALVEFPPPQESTTTSPKSAGEALTKLPLLGPPGRIRIRKKIVRIREQIPPVLAVAFWDCVRGRTPWPLFMHGGVGTGKTCAALFLCDYVAGRAIFRDFGQLCSDHQDAKMSRLIWEGSYSQTLVRPGEYWDDWRHYALCVLDEIGARDSVSDHVYETLKMAVDTRYGMPLVLISNVGLKRLAELFDDRIASRCAGGTVVHLEGDDRRISISGG